MKPVPVPQVVPVVPSGSVGRGNTISLPTRRLRCSPSKNWAFTLNNYDSGSIGSIISVLDKMTGCRACIGREVGESGTPHLQGFIHFGHKVRPKSVIKDDRIHWEKCIKSEYTNIEYCKKGGDYILHNLPDMIAYDMSYADLPVLRPWQLAIAERHAEPPPMFHNKIYWYYEPRGAVGKTMLGRYFALRHKGVYLQGAGKHILATAFKSPSFHYIFGLTRADREKMSYRSLESLNDNFYMSGFGVEATGMICRKTAWTIVLANFEPDYDMISRDRWVVENLAVSHNLYSLDDCDIQDSDEEADDMS
jgi:hypothetical protein